MASLEPAELKAMVSAIRHTEAVLGSGIGGCESFQSAKHCDSAQNIAARPISKGERFSHDNLTVKRPGNGISPMLWDTEVGLEAPRAISNLTNWIELRR